MITVHRPQSAIDREVAAARAAATAELGALVGAERRKHLTDLPFQDMVYMRKEVRARECLADPAPDPADYPLLAAEIGITGANVTEVATVVVARADFLEGMAAAIETVRLGVENELAAATTIAAIDAIMAALPAQLAALPQP